VAGCCPVECESGVFDRLKVVSHLEDCLAGKAVATLKKRGQSLLMYVRWAQSAHWVPFPFREKAVYEYMCALRLCKAPATRANAFLQAVNFSEHVLMLPPSEAVMTPRVRGAAARSFERKRLLKQRDPLTVEQVRLLEAHLLSSQEVTAVFAGFILFLVYSRCRHSDAQRLEQEPVIDGRYLEAGSCRTKTSSRASRRRRMLPISAPVDGVLGPWASRWVDLRRLHALKVTQGGPLLPCPTKSGWSEKPISAFETGLWLKEVIAQLSDQPLLALGNIGSHSCKATGLSWAAKYGLSHDVRRLLGYHTAGKDETMLLYSRQAMSSPLRAFETVLAAVKSGAFCPDADRSGQFTGQHDAPPQDCPPPLDPAVSDPLGLEEESEEDGFGPRVPLPMSAVEESEKDEEGSSTSSSSPDVPDESSEASSGEVHAAATVVAAAVQRELPTDREWPPESVRMHVIRGTYHLLRPDSTEALRCGRVVTDSFVPIPRIPAFMSPRCRMCETAFASA
jgi:integrase